jgi:hypothetical protein
MRKFSVLLLASLCLSIAPNARAQNPLTATIRETPRLSALQKMPIKELTVFKDGHAFVLHEGVMPTDAAGNVVLDYLPTPVIGTFWAYASTPGARLVSVTASPQRTLIERTALSLRELLEANVGAAVFITESAPTSGIAPPQYAATITSVPQRSSAELEITGAPALPRLDQYGRPVPVFDGDKPLPQKGDIILLQTESGIKALPLAQIRDVTFQKTPRGKTDNEEWRNLLTLNLNWKKAPQRQADVGLMYLQRGVRWIPSYRVTLLDKNRARVELQATLINEMADFQNAAVNLVIGVPSFAFKETPDPISLQNTFAQLSPYFRGDNASAMSNAMMSQGLAGPAGAYGPVPREAGANINIGPEIAGGGKNEDLFVFHVQNLSLKKGERIALPVAQYDLPYKDVFALDIPFAPPAEALSSWNSEQQRQAAQLLSAPKVQHKIRLTNTSREPLTTAPALVIKDGQLLAQGMTTYTAPGGECDVEVTSTVDVRVTKSDVEVGRTPKAEKWNGYDYSRLDLKGSIELCSYRSQPMDVEVTRYVLGEADSATRGGVIEKMNVFEDRDFLPGGQYPVWWNYGNWNQGWNHFNGVSRIRWTAHLEPEKEVTLEYAWHYFWRG